MKTSIPNKFPNWQASPKDPYTSDIIRSRNIRLSEISVTGEVDTQNVLSLTSSQSELVSSIFKDPDHTISFALKNKSYYIDSLTTPTVTEYSPDIPASFNLNPQSTGMFVFPRGYANYSEDHHTGTTGTSSSDINTFADVLLFQRVYTYTVGQTVTAAHMAFTYTQSAGTNIVRIVVVDSIGSHVVLTDPSAHAAGNTWDYWFLDGTNGCNLNDPAGFTIKLQVATGSGANTCTFGSSSYFDLMLEMGNTSLLSTGVNGIYTQSEIAGTSSVTAWYPGSASYSHGYGFGYPSTSSVFSQTYPTVLKMFNDRILVIGNGSEVHLVDTNGNGNLLTPGANAYLQTLNVTMGVFSVDALSLPAGYVIEWIDTTSDTIYIGATKYDSGNYFEETGKTLILVYQPQSGSSITYEVTDGRCVGKVLNNFLYILTCSGNIKLLYSGEFQQLTQIYQIPDDYTIQLPHTNGVDIYNDMIAWLVPGNKYAPAGIYVFDPIDNNVYHKHSPFYSTLTEYDIGGNQPQAVTGALMFYDSSDAFFAGIDGLINQTGTYIGGLFDTLNIKDNNIGNNGYLELRRIKSTEVDEIPDSYSIKCRGVGNIMLAQKKEETSLPCTDGIYQGDWGGSVSNPAYFTMTTVPNFMKSGDRITILDGIYEGFSTNIKNIAGTTLTINPVSKYYGYASQTTSGTFTFLWEKLGYTGVFTDTSTLTVDASTAAIINIGDELEFTAGLNAGQINYVASISGTAITLLNAMDYVGSNYTLFNIDKYSYLYSYVSTAWDAQGVTWDSGLQWDSASENTNNIITDERNNEPESADFVQYKLMVTGSIRIREFQVNTKQNLSITNNITGVYSPKKKK
jgi:hypothetical protein